ncbi:hypothetical protein KA119_00005 [Candidatus Gracilibacteria bacterium]|nr:hypothetical protein [Candidatus Gracilibacteria bacterium]
MAQLNNNKRVKNWFLPLLIFSCVIILWITYPTILPYLSKTISLEENGQYGDMFGGLNALFSGLAFGGLIYTIYLQTKELELQRTEIKLQREELAKSAKALSEQAAVMKEQQRMDIEREKKRKYRIKPDFFWNYEGTLNDSSTGSRRLFLLNGIYDSNECKDFDIKHIQGGEGFNWHIHRTNEGNDCATIRVRLEGDDDILKFLFEYFDMDGNEYKEIIEFNPLDKTFSKYPEKADELASESSLAL